MPILIRCSACQSELRVRDEVAGKKVRCPKCTAVITATPEEEEVVADVVEEDPGDVREGPSRRRRSEEPRDDDEPRHDEPWRRRRPRYDDERDDDWDETRSGTGRMPPTVLTPVIVLSILLTLELILGALALDDGGDFTGKRRRRRERDGAQGYAEGCQRAVEAERAHDGNAAGIDGSAQGLIKRLFDQTPCTHGSCAGFPLCRYG